MSERGDRVFRDVHRLARVYHWSAGEILGLSLPHRRKYLALILEEEASDLAASLGLES